MTDRFRQADTLSTEDEGKYALTDINKYDVYGSTLEMTFIRRQTSNYVAATRRDEDDRP